MTRQASACNLPRHCRLYKRWWVYVWLTALDYVYPAQGAGCNLRERLRSFSGILPKRRGDYVVGGTCDYAKHSEEPDGDGGAVELLRVKRRQSTRAGEATASLAERSTGGCALSREEEKQCEAMHNQIMSLRNWLPEAETSSTSDRENVDPCKDTDIQGLEAVTYFFRYLPLRQGDYSLQSALFPSSQPVTMTSVLTGRQAKYHCTEKVNVCTVEDDDGQSFSVRIRRRKYEVTRAVVRRTINKLTDYLMLHKTFDETSLHSVECKYRMLTLRDILVHPGNVKTRACVASTAGFLLNYFLLFSPLKANLLTFVRTVEAQKGSSAEMERLARIARLNLSLQVIQLVGNVRRKHIVLPRLRLHHLRLSASGTVYFLPLKPPRKELEVVSSEPEAYNYIDGNDTTSSRVDSRTNELDTAVVLVHVWCPSEATALSFSVDAATQDKLLEAILYPRCSDMPKSLRQIIVENFRREADDAETMFSASYEHVENLLLETIESG